MTVAAKLKFSQAGNPGTAGVALYGTIVAGACTAANDNDANVQRLVFTFIDVPPASALTVGVKQDGPTKTWTFTPDVVGPYLVMLEVYDAQGNVATTYLCFAVKDASGRCPPPCMVVPDGKPQVNPATALNFNGNTRSYAPMIEGYLLGNAGGWGSLLDLDFTALGAIPLNTDGDYTIAGKTWTKVRSANESVHASISAADGLKFTPAAGGTDYNGASLTCPGLWLPMTQLLPTFDPSMGVRITVYNPTDNATAIYDSSIVALATNSTSWGHVLKRGYGTVAPPGAQSFIEANAANLGFASDSFALGATNETLVLEIPRAGALVLYPYKGSYPAGDFPAKTALTPLKGNTQTIAAPDLTGAYASPLGIFLGAQRFNSATAYVTKFKRLKVEYRL